ncbi:MAG: hypothetical protein INF10_07430, partial [Methylobacterium sp.]|nr:hypothetical protein [Methylobacterium sp.]
MFRPALAVLAIRAASLVEGLAAALAPVALRAILALAEFLERLAPVAALVIVAARRLATSGRRALSRTRLLAGFRTALPRRRATTLFTWTLFTWSLPTWTLLAAAVSGRALRLPIRTI